MIPNEEKDEEESAMKMLISLMLAAVLLLTAFPVMAESNGNALIIYFDYSENIDTTGLDVDAISQASMAGTRARDISNLLVIHILVSPKLC